MPAVKYKIELSTADRKKLQEIVTKGKSSAKTILRANILLASDQQNPKYMTVSEIASIYHISATTVQNVRTSYANSKEYGMERRKYTLNSAKHASKMAEWRIRIGECWNSGQTFISIMS